MQPGALTLEAAPGGRGSNGWEPALLLTCLEPTGLANAMDAAQHGFYVPEPPSHVEELRVRGRGRELPEHIHVCLGQGVAVDVATCAQVLVQRPHPGGLVTNAQDGRVGGSCKDTGTRVSRGAGVHLLPMRRYRTGQSGRRTQTGGCLGERGGWGVSASGASFWGDGNVLELDRDGGCTTL